MGGWRHLDFVCISVFVCARVYLDFFLFSDYFWHNKRLAEAAGGYFLMNYIFGSLDGFTSIVYWRLCVSFVWRFGVRLFWSDGLSLIVMMFLGVFHVFTGVHRPYAALTTICHSRLTSFPIEIRCAKLVWYTVKCLHSSMKVLLWPMLLVSSSAQEMVATDT